MCIKSHRFLCHPYRSWEFHDGIKYQCPGVTVPKCRRFWRALIYIYILYILISRSWSILPFIHPFWFGLNRQPFLTVPKCLVVVLTVVHAVQAAGFVFVPRQIWRKFYLVKFDHFINKSLNNYNYECENNCSRTSYNKCSWFKLPSGCFGGWFFTSC